MTQFMDVHHNMKGITGEEFLAAHKADQKYERQEGVEFQHAWADPVSGTGYCLSEAPSAAAVKRVHEMSGHPADEIHPVTLSV